MAIVTQKNCLNIQPGSVPVTVHLSQGDVGNTIGFYLYNGSEPFYPDGYQVSVHGIRMDGVGFGPYSVTTVSGQNYVAFDVTEAMTSVCGAALAELTITNASGTSVGTANFAMLVEQGTFPNGPVYSTDISVYQRILSYVQTMPATLRNDYISRIGAEASTRAAEDILLQSQIDELVAPSGEAPSAAEVENARIGEDGTLYDTLGNAIRTQVRNVKESFQSEDRGLLQSLIRNYVDPDTLLNGYYAHSDPSTINSGTSTKYAKPIRIYAGVPYTFKNVFGYFSCIKYDDGTIYNLSDSASPNTVTVSVTPAQNGYAYITINNANYTSAMVVGGQDNYAGAVFRGYYGILNTFPYDHVIPSNYADVLPTMASAKANTVYRITSTSDMTVSGTMTDVPTELTLSSTSSMLVTIGGNETVLTFQLLITERGNAYIRRYYRNSSQVIVWSAWEPLHNVVEKITPSNYQTALPDWKTAGNGSLYQIISTASMASGNWADVPSPLKEAPCISILQTFGDPTASGCMQICTVANRGEIYTRWLNNISGTLTWTNWASNKTGRSAAIIVDAAGNGDYTSFTEAVKYAAELQDAYVLVMPGTYDIIAEYKALYGNDFFDNYDASTRDDGIVLKNGITVEFSPNAYLVCNYTGSNAVMQQKFSPLVSGVNGFTLIGCNLTSRKVRYSMHDERRTNTDYYHNRYVGCHFNHDKGDGAGYIQALGGGLGKNGFVEIENCIFENPSSTGSILSYHNSEADGARSQVIIKDSFIKGSIKFSWYGPSTLVSTMMITGCKMYADPVMTSTKPSYDVQNVEILAWNNVIQA